MFFQRILASLDKLLSEIFWLESWGIGDENSKTKWIYFVDIGHTIGVMGTDGKIHTMMGYWSVLHYYDGKKLLKRIPIRKDLKPGERLATLEEIQSHQAELRKRFSEKSGLTVS
jgi:hypothetical protein